MPDRQWPRGEGVRAADDRRPASDGMTGPLRRALGSTDRVSRALEQGDVARVRPDAVRVARKRPNRSASLGAPTSRRVQEAVTSGILLLASVVSVLTTIGIVAVLLYEATSFFDHV